LSPKKATQLAFAKEVDEDEDELATTEKTPLKQLSKSPIKAPGTASKLSFTSSTIIAKASTSSPTKDLGASIMASPARRAPPSPFKEALKYSPKRGAGFGESAFQQQLKAPTPSLKATASPFKMSLLQSPARRPASPSKNVAPGSPGRSTIVVPAMDAATVLSEKSAFKLPQLSPSKSLTSAFEAARSPGSRGLKSVIKQHECDVDGKLGGLPFNLSRIETTPPKIDTVETPSITPSKAIVASTVKPSDLTLYSPLASMEESTIQALDIERVTEVALPVCSTHENLGIAPSITPQALSFSVTGRAFNPRTPAMDPFADLEGCSDSEDELQLLNAAHDSPLQHFNASKEFGATSDSSTSSASDSAMSSSRVRTQQLIPMTPLVNQLSNWFGASPEVKATVDAGMISAGRTSPANLPGLSFPSTSQDPSRLEPKVSPAKSTFFEDEMSVRDQTEASASLEDKLTVGTDNVPLMTESIDITMPVIETDLEMVDAVEPFDNTIVDAATDVISDASQEYVDENTIDPALFTATTTAAPIPAAVQPSLTVTPERAFDKQSSQRVFHTVCKVPLKPAAAETSPSKPPLKRSNSISGFPSPKKGSSLQRNQTLNTLSPRKRNASPSGEYERRYATPVKVSKGSPQTPGTTMSLWSTFGTPARTPRRDINPATLRGAVVYVDVHTSEGENASNIFVELLTAMGARCVKQWNWNPSVDGESGGSRKVGITHVVFKDGGKRTIEKVRESGGVVTCVGVNWVLDCERENKWLEETAYAIDTSLVPRGGQRRRKSMEPRALANINGTLVAGSVTSSSGSGALATPAKANGSASPTKEFLNLSSPINRRQSTLFVPSPDHETLEPSTPEQQEQYHQNAVYDFATPKPNSPTDSDIATPYFLHPNQLVQQTCPQNQMGEAPEFGERSMDAPARRLLFPESGEIDEVQDPNLKRRLEAARRKTMAHVPKNRSPLSRRC
jgi:hypothetical protein